MVLLDQNKVENETKTLALKERNWTLEAAQTVVKGTGALDLEV